MYDTEHYVALMTRLSHEKQYLSQAVSEGEIELRSVWIKQIEKEIEQEAAFLLSKGIDVYSTDDNNLSDDDLLAELLN